MHVTCSQAYCIYIIWPKLLLHKRTTTQSHARNLDSSYENNACCGYATRSVLHLCYLQIFGVDILLDDTFRAWLIEVNTGPDLSSTSPLDKQLKHKMVAQLMHLVGVIPYDR